MIWSLYTIFLYMSIYDPLTQGSYHLVEKFESNNMSPKSLCHMSFRWN